MISQVTCYVSFLTYMMGPDSFWWIYQLSEFGLYCLVRRRVFFFHFFSCDYWLLCYVAISSWWYQNLQILSSIPEISLDLDSVSSNKFLQNVTKTRAKIPGKSLPGKYAHNKVFSLFLTPLFRLFLSFIPFCWSYRQGFLREEGCIFSKMNRNDWQETIPKSRQNIN